MDEEQRVTGSDVRPCILLRCAPAWRRDYVIAMRACQHECVVTAATVNHDNFRAAFAYWLQRDQRRRDVSAFIEDRDYDGELQRRGSDLVGLFRRNLEDR